jgi:aminoglycoside phosphotransferase (APT) family kinase protein
VEPQTAERYFAIDRKDMAEAVRALLAESAPSLVPDSIAFSRSPYASSHFLVDVAVSTRKAVTHFVLKDTGSISHAAKAPRQHLPQSSDRESNVYAAVLRGIDGPPRYFGALRGAHRHWLLLERVRGRELTKVGDHRIWRLAARWLGRFHGLETDFSKDGVSRGEAYFRDALRRALPALEAADPNLGLHRVVRAWDPVVELLLATPACLVHGDAFPANVVVGPQDRVCFVDWELAGMGPGLLDLAAFTAGSWTASEREGMNNGYEAGLRDSRAPSSSSAGLTRRLLASRILVAVEMIGAMSSWEPPSHQLWDWPRELATLARELAL